MAGQHFDFLAGLLFDETYGIHRAAIIPHAVVMERAKFVTRSNSHKFILRDDIWEAPGVRDVTPELAAAAAHTRLQTPYSCMGMSLLPIGNEVI